MKPVGFTIVVLVLTLLSVGCDNNGSPEQENPALVVFAAASLRDVVRDIGARFSEAHQVDLIYNFAGSNTLAQQLRAAPVADVFLSANPEWVEVLDRAGLTLPESRRNFVSNRLALISRKDAEFHLSAPGRLPALPFSFLALADPEAVPAGRYAKTFLQMPWQRQTARSGKRSQIKSSRPPMSGPSSAWSSLIPTSSALCIERMP